MGVMRFLVDPPELLDDWPEAHEAYISTADGRIHPTRVEIEDRILSCRRFAAESGKLHVPWPVDGLGRPVLSTATLPEREDPYHLPVELARGKISQLRDQVGFWEVAGMDVPDRYRLLDGEAYRLLARAAACQTQTAEAGRLARESLAKATQAEELLSIAYCTQRLAARTHRFHQLPVSLGCGLGQSVPEGPIADRLGEAFNVALLPVEWRHIESIEGDYDWSLPDAQIDFALENKLIPYYGPLLDFSPNGLPRWLRQWANDFFNLQSFVNDFVETAISRYAGRIRNWEICARANTGGALGLSEQPRLTLVASLLEAARRVNEDHQLSIRVDQPWGDYQARGQHQLSPMQFVDALLRGTTGLSAVNLEINVGYYPRGSACRGPLDFSQLIDEWSFFGIPLYVTLAVPSASEPDAHAAEDHEVGRPCWKSAWSEATQADLVEQYVPTLMAKQSVAGIFWSHLSDAVPHEHPHAGLFRGDHTPKQAFARFLDYRKAYWPPEQNAADRGGTAR